MAEFKMFKPALFLLALASAVPFTHASAAEQSLAQLQAQPKISQEKATATALARVPKGKVQSAELEHEKGKLVWSFDIAQENRSGVTEIQVDARTGRIVSQKQESASQEAAEASQEGQER